MHIFLSLNTNLRVGIFIALFFTVSLLSLPARAADCANPTRAEGTQIYNKDYNLMQYCNGTDWISMSGIAPAAGGCGDAPYLVDFTDLTDQPLNTVLTTSIISINGISAAAPVSITGANSPEFQICNDFDCSTVDHAWGSTGQDIDSGQYLQVRQTSDTTPNTTVIATATIGALSIDWLVHTRIIYAFITSSLDDADMGFSGVSSADSTCQSLASSAGLTGTYMAWLGDSNDISVDPESRFIRYNNDPYFRTDGVKIADNWADLVDGSLDNPLDVDENGTTIVSDWQVWSNVTAAGAVQGLGNGDSCTSWNQNSTLQDGYVGDASKTDSQWTTTGSRRACELDSRFYCFRN